MADLHVHVTIEIDGAEPTVYGEPQHAVVLSSGDGGMMVAVYPKSAADCARVADAFRDLAGRMGIRDAVHGDRYEAIR